MAGKKVRIIEVRQGDEKLRDAQGFRRDSMPIVESLRKVGVDADIVFYSREERDALLQQLSQVNAVMSRVNPGNIAEGESEYFDFLRKLGKAGVKLLPSPDAMISYGAKDGISKLAGTSLVPADCFSYHTQEQLESKFPQTLATGIRVLKQNRGSQGSGIWRVQVDPSHQGPLDANTPIVCMEAFDNHTENFTLGNFMKFCNQYIVGENGLMVDMPYLPRIVEGEIRILMVGETPIFVVHKKPVDGGFSSTLGSGATYVYQKPEEWKDLVDAFLGSIPEMRQRLGDEGSPIIWTADFILGPVTAEGKQTYVLGEINCSCVGFTSHLDCGIQEKIAQEVIKRLA